MSFDLFAEIMEARAKVHVLVDILHEHARKETAAMAESARRSTGQRFRYVIPTPLRRFRERVERNRRFGLGDRFLDFDVAIYLRGTDISGPVLEALEAQEGEAEGRAIVVGRRMTLEEACAVAKAAGAEIRFHVEPK